MGAPGFEALFNPPSVGGTSALSIVTQRHLDT